MSLRSRGAQFAGKLDSWGQKAGAAALNHGLMPAGMSSPVGGPTGSAASIAATQAFGPFAGPMLLGAAQGVVKASGYHPGHKGAAWGVQVGDSGTGLSGAYQAEYDMGATKTPGRVEASSPARSSGSGFAGQLSGDELDDVNSSLNSFLGRPAVANTPQPVSPQQFSQYQLPGSTA